MFPSKDLNCFSPTPATPASTAITREENVTLHRPNTIPIATWPWTLQTLWSEILQTFVFISVKLNIRKLIELIRLTRRIIFATSIGKYILFGYILSGACEFLGRPTILIWPSNVCNVKDVQTFTYQQNSSQRPLSTRLHDRIFPTFLPRIYGNEFLLDLCHALYNRGQEFRDQDNQKLQRHIHLI